MVLAPDLTIKNGSSFDCFNSIKVLKFQILVRGRFENDPHGRGVVADKIFFSEKIYETIV